MKRALQIAIMPPIEEKILESHHILIVISVKTSESDI